MSSTISIIIITLCLISGQGVCFDVHGCTGGSLLFKCIYPHQANSAEGSTEAYLRKDGSKIISSVNQRRWDYNDRFALYDDEKSRFFQVYIKNLIREDEGDYSCGKNNWKHDVEINVEDEANCGTTVIHPAILGQESTFLCKYPEKYKTNTKVLYKQKPEPAFVLNSSSQSSTENFNLSDNQKDHFKVTIHSASTSDEDFLCGVERHGSDQQPSSVTHTTFFQHIHLNITNKITSVLVQAYISRSVFIKCQFPQQLKTNNKFFQRAEKQKITVASQNEWERHDRVHMYDDTTEGRLKVFISDLTEADEGTYKCGVEVNDDDLIIEVKLNVKQAHDFHADSKATVFIGETANFTCNHPEKNTMTTKNICKENDAGICQNIPSSDRKRIQLSDSSAGVFFSNVSLTNQGVYWCALKTKEEHLTYISTTTKLKLAVTMPPVVGREGASAQIRCPNTSNNIKYLCTQKCFTQDAQILIQSDEAHVENRFSVKDQTELGVFTVNISDLTADDAGIYWCAEKDTYNIPTNLMIIMKDAPVTHQASVGGLVSIRCKHITTLTQHHQRLFCRGTQPNVCARGGVLVSSTSTTNERFSLTDQSLAGDFTVTISRLVEEDSGIYWCGEETSGSFLFTEAHLNVSREQTLADTRITHYVISVVSVGLIVMAVCLLLMLVFKKKRNSKPDTRQTGDHESASPSTSPEEISGSAPLNSTVQTPTMPSDGLLYAAVSFQKHDESLSEAAVAFNQDENQCEYAAVNHRSTADQ